MGEKIAEAGKSSRRVDPLQFAVAVVSMCLTNTQNCLTNDPLARWSRYAVVSMPTRVKA
jgi:hypothetical protein